MKRFVNQVFLRRFLLFLIVGLAGLVVGIIAASPQGGGVLRSLDNDMTIQRLDPAELRAFIGQTYQVGDAFLRDGVVASRNGEVYYHPDCSGWERINEENRVWFLTVEEAEQEGYRVAKSCQR